MDWTDRTAPDEAALLALAEATVAALPDTVRPLAAAVTIHVVDWAPDHVLDDLGIAHAIELTGLYDGIPLTERSYSDQPTQPDAIWLYRRPILDEWADRGTVSLGALVAHVVIHELAHHFGWSDADIAEIDRWWE